VRHGKASVPVAGWWMVAAPDHRWGSHAKAATNVCERLVGASNLSHNDAFVSTSGVGAASSLPVC